MSWWDRLRGHELPSREHAPEGETPGRMRNGRKDGVWIEKGEKTWDWPWDDWLLECVYRDGVRSGGYRCWTKHLRERGSFADGEREGEVERFTEDGRRYLVAGYRRGKLHGTARSWDSDGTLLYEREYRDGERWAGVFELRSWPEGNVFERREYADGRPSGRWEDYQHGALSLRCHYEDGQLHGPWSSHYERRTAGTKDGVRFEGGGEPKLTGAYRRGAQAGVWQLWRLDGTLAAERDLDGDGRWRAGGHVISPADESELERWVTLADAWSRYTSPGGRWGEVEGAILEWPTGREAEALRWVHERIAERGDEPLPARTTGGAEWGRVFGSDDEPRTWVVDGIDTDHHLWDADTVQAVVTRAFGLSVLWLDEVDFEPDCLERLFRGVAWPRLARLGLMECGPLAKVMKLLAEAEWAGSLRELALTSFGDMTSKDAARLIASPRLGHLRALTLGGLQTGRSLPEAIARAPLFDGIERLALHFDGRANNVLAALAARRTPALRRLELTCFGNEPSKPELLCKLVDAALHPALTWLSVAGVDEPQAVAEQLAVVRPSLEVEIG